MSGCHCLQRGEILDFLSLYCGSSVPLAGHNPQALQVLHQWRNSWGRTDFPWELLWDVPWDVPWDVVPWDVVPWEFPWDDPWDAPWDVP